MHKEPIETNTTDAISPEEIDKCISILEQLVTDTDQIFDIPKEKRTALIKATGMLSRPSRVFSSKKRWKESG